MKKGLAGSTLKIIAMSAMLIDHIGAAILARMLMAGGLRELDTTNASAVTEWLAVNGNLYDTYTLLRMIGRIAFPIFCFLLVEGFLHTSNKKKYAIRLFIFALVSEIPFDLAFQSKMFGFEYQNVFFTLGIGVVTLMAYKRVEEKEFSNRLVKSICAILVSGAGMLAAEVLQTDYAALGVMVIIMFYLFRGKRIYQIVASGILFLDNITALFAFLPILAYNGERGLKIKYAFYAFYPLHLLILFVICWFMGLAGYAAV